MINWWLSRKLAACLGVVLLLGLIASIIVLLAKSGSSFGLCVVDVFFLISISIVLVKKQNV